MATFCETHVKPLNNFDEVRRRIEGWRKTLENASTPEERSYARGIIEYLEIRLKRASR